jgi:hypothetical protein
MSYGMFVLVVVFGALLGERLLRLKRQVNIDSFFGLSLFLAAGYCNYILCILGRVSSLRIEEHYKWYESSFVSYHTSKF